MRMKKVMTVPNALSVFRILLVPTFIYFYFSTNVPNNLLFAVLTLILSGLTDIADGTIARTFHMVSDLGKILDPIADKLTQVTVVICLATRNRQIIPLVILLFAKEFVMLLGAVRLMKMGKRPSEAKWWGKLSTVVLFVSLILFLLTGIYHFLSDWMILMLVIISSISILFSLFNYYPIFKDIQQGDSQTS